MNCFMPAAERTARAFKRERGLQGRFPPAPSISYQSVIVLSKHQASAKTLRVPCVLLLITTGLCTLRRSRTKGVRLKVSDVGQPTTHTADQIHVGWSDTRNAPAFNVLRRPASFLPSGFE
jgi:hypothetical protein